MTLALMAWTVEPSVGGHGGGIPGGGTHGMYRQDWYPSAWKLE